MKKILDAVVWTAIILSTFTIVSAQENKLSEQEMTALRNNASEKLKSKRYRVKMSSEVYRTGKDSVPSWLSKTTIEYTPDGYHAIGETKSADGVSRTEMIETDGRRFSKLNKEAWKELSTTEGQGNGMGSFTPVESKETVENKYLGKQSLGAQTADLYEIKTITKYQINGKESISVITERFWLNRDGLFLKSEKESVNNNKLVSHAVREYEYDSNIKVEAPLKSVRRKSK